MKTENVELRGKCPDCGNKVGTVMDWDTDEDVQATEDSEHIKKVWECSKCFYIIEY